MRLRKREILQNEEIELMAKVSDALAHPARIRMLRYIMQCNRQMQNVCTGDLVEEFGYAQATVSQHMSKLTQSGLVEKKKENKFTYYFVSLGVLQKYLNIVKNFDKLEE